MIKKILYLRNAPYKPNINNYNMQEIGFAKAFLNMGISTDIMYYSNENNIQEYISNEKGSVRILWTKGYKILRTGYYPQILKKGFLDEYDLIITTEYGQIMTYLVSKMKKNCTLYSGPYYNLFKLKFISPVYDFLFTNKINKKIKTVFVKSILAKEYLEKKGYTNVVSLGVGLDTEKFELENSVKPETEKVLKYMTENNCLLFVGTLDERKNYPFILEVFKLLKTKYSSELKLVLIGKGKKEYIESKMQKMPDCVINDIYHVESIENAQLKYIYEASQMFLLPSKLEIFGMVMLEAMYFSNCVFSSINGGSLTLIENGKTGYVFDEFNVENWATEIYKAEMNPEKTGEIANNARKCIIENFTWDKIAERFFSNLDIW